MHPPSQTQSQTTPSDRDDHRGRHSGPSNDHRDGEMIDQVDFRRYQAPRRHGEVFVEPALDAAVGLLDQNRQSALEFGTSLIDLRRRARAHLVDAATQYTAVYRGVDWVDATGDRPIMMAGHQPELFHPGVWFKNHALSRLASETSSLAINLIVDNDVAASSSIRVPIRDAESGRLRTESIAYDDTGGGVPYEQTTIRNRELFDQFDRRVGDAIGPLIADPCIDRLWTHAREAAGRCGVAGCALAQARHALEEEIGLQTLEVPLGAVCRSVEFAEFGLGILSELPRFQRCYNDAADTYRRAHGIRSSAHPVPNLADDGQWFEAPLWIYGNDSPVRRAAWARLAGDDLIISDRRDKHVRVGIGYPKLAAEQLASAASPDFKLRPRALLTTMYARLVLSDLFLHGIGGGKYDQLGDLIIRSFFGQCPPQFMVISATVLLPGFDSSGDRGEEIRRLKREIRDTRFQGERFADQAELDPALLARKRQLLAEIPPAGDKKAWNDELIKINDRLSRLLAETRAQRRRQLARVERDAAEQTLLGSREHPFCLYPLDYLTETFNRLL